MSFSLCACCVLGAEREEEKEGRREEEVAADGKPASSSIAGLTHSLSHTGAKADEKRAARIAMGAANRMAMMVMTSFYAFARLPATGGSNQRFQVFAPPKDQ